MWKFETDCIHSDGDSINDMKRAAVPVSYATLRRVLGRAFLEKQADLGYNIDNQRGGLRMSKDWHVAYYKSTYQGRPCYYFVWSGIEQIFTESGGAMTRKKQPEVEVPVRPVCPDCGKDSTTCECGGEDEEQLEEGDDEEQLEGDEEEPTEPVEPRIRLLRFSAGWCSFCRTEKKSKAVEQFAVAHPEIEVIEVDADEEEELATAYGADGLPHHTFDLVTGEEEEGTEPVILAVVVGLATKLELERGLKKAKKAAAGT